MPDNQQPDILYLKEIAKQIITEKVRGLRKKLNMNEVEDLLKCGDLSVYIRPDGKIYTCGHNKDSFFEVTEKGEIISPLVRTFFANYIPKVENGEVKYYERVK